MGYVVAPKPRFYSVSRFEPLRSESGGHFDKTSAERKPFFAHVGLWPPLGENAGLMGVSAVCGSSALC